MSGRAFVDTNVLIYAYDVEAGAKHIRAVEMMTALWQSHTGVLSTQVLQEFYVNVTRKIPKPLTPAAARAIMASYRAWPVVCIDVDDVLAASELQERNVLSYWDALIVQAALRAGAEHILSEDFNADQRIEGIVVTNPFGDD